MKHAKFKVFLTLLLVFMLCVPMVVFADEGNVPPPEDIETRYTDYSIGYTINRAIVGGSSEIYKLSSSSVKIQATTECSESISLTAKAYLEWYKDGAWRDYNSTSYTTKTATGTSVTASKIITVTPGYYYRTSGVHMGDGATLLSDTNGVYVG